MNGKYDRSYEYDHAGRIKRALSGAEARGGPTTQDRPYKENFNYDAFNHITTRTTSNWSKVPGFFSGDSYANNRRTDWLYDADGNLTSNVRQYTYDAAGRMTFISGGNTNRFFDGNDQPVKMTEPNVVTYYLRSAVLGQLIAELDAAGTKTRGYIYLGAKLLASQYQNGSITFEHDDPSRTKLRYTHAQLGNETAGAAELDPMGADVYLWDPYLEDPGFEGRGEGFGEFGNVSEPSTGCTVDGLYSPCDIAFRLLQQGAAVEAPMKLTRYNRERKRFEFFRAYADGYSGYVPADAQYGSGGVARRFSHYDYTSVTVSDTGQTSGAWHAVFETLALAEPQKTGLDPTVSALVSNALASSDCIQFARTVLNGVSNKENPVFPAGGSLVDVFNAFLAQGTNHPLITHNKPSNSWGHGNPVGNIKKGDAAVFSPNGVTTGSLADTIIAELFHLAGQNKAYTDEQLAKAVYNSSYASDAALVIAPEANIFNKQRYQARGWRKDQAYSAYFHYIQMLHCTAVPQPPGKPRRIN